MPENKFRFNPGNGKSGTAGLQDNGLRKIYVSGGKERKVSLKKQKGGEMKGIRLTFNISLHDLETRAHQAEKFLKEGDKIRIEMVLRGREKAHADFAKEKISQFLEILEKQIPFKIERELKREPRGFTIIISKNRYMKTRKSILKRFKITKTGKVLRRPTGLDHYRAKKSGKKIRKSRKWVTVSKWEAKKIKKLINS